MNTLFKNTEAQITQKIGGIYEQWQGWMQGPKITSRVGNRSNQLKLDTQMSNEWTECTSSEEALQQNKVNAISKKNVIFMNLSIKV